jgi:hypothetical protein
MATPTAQNGDGIPVYLSFASFRSAVQNLRAHGLPDTLDRSAWRNRSGGEQGQIISAFKFLGLIDQASGTQPALRRLVTAEENSNEEKAILKELLQEHYDKLFSVDLTTATPKQVSDAIGSYGTSGATKDRAIRFFLKTAQHCGIPLSSRLTAGMRLRATSSSTNEEPEETEGANMAQQPTGVRKTRRRRQQNVATPENQSNSPNPPSSAMKMIQLPKAGGTLAITGTFNLFALGGEERELVFKIIDMMNAFEQQKQTTGE